MNARDLCSSGKVRPREIGTQDNGPRVKENFNDARNDRLIEKRTC